MLYRVHGTNRETGARMALELNADSKGDAERKATQTGMIVIRAEPAGQPGDAEAQRGFKPIRQSSGMLPKLAVLVVLAILAFLLRGQIGVLTHGIRH